MKRTLALRQLCCIVGQRGSRDGGRQRFRPAGSGQLERSGYRQLNDRPAQIPSAQSTGAYPGARGATGSTQPDATNPVRSNPSGGGGVDSGGGGASGGASR